VPRSDSRRIWTVAFARIFVAHFFLSISYFAMVLFPLYVQHLQGDEVDIGLLAATGLAAGILLRWSTAPLWDRIDRRWLFLTGGILNLSGLLLMLQARGVSGLLFLAAALQGAGGGVLFGTFFAVAAGLLPAERRSEGVGLFGISGLGGSYVGVWLGELVLAHGGFGWLFPTAAGAGLLSLLMSLRLPETRPLEGPSGDRTPDAPAGSFLRLWAISILFGASTSVARIFLAPFAEGLGIRPVWPFFLAYSAVAILLRLLAGSLPDRAGPRRVLWPALLCFASGLLVLPSARGPGHLMLSGVLCGAGHGYGFPILNALIVARSGSGRERRHVGLFTSFLDVGGLIGGPVLGVVGRSHGYAGLFGCAGLTLAAGATLLIWLDGRLDRYHAGS